MHRPPPPTPSHHTPQPTPPPPLPPPLLGSMASLAPIISSWQACLAAVLASLALATATFTTPTTQPMNGAYPAPSNALPSFKPVHRGEQVSTLLVLIHRNLLALIPRSMLTTLYACLTTLSAALRARWSERSWHCTLRAVCCWGRAAPVCHACCVYKVHLFLLRLCRPASSNNSRMHPFLPLPYPFRSRYIEVLGHPIETRYSEVFWTAQPPVALPPDFVAR